MRARETCLYTLIIGGLLVFAGGASQAEQSKSGTQSGSTMGSGSESSGGSSGTMKSGHESSGKMKQEPFGRTGEPKAGGEATLGGSGQIPDALPKGSNSEKRSSPGTGSGDTRTSPGQTGSSGGNMGSSGGSGQ